MPGIEPNQSDESGHSTAKCRTCVDFKSWAKQQRKSTKQAQGSQVTQEKTTTLEQIEIEKRRPDCPLDKDDLGRSTWNLLHTMAATYPNKPSKQQVDDVNTFFGAFSRLYPCEPCAKDLVKELKLEPIDASSQHAFSQWICRLHNRINVKLDKPVFDCSKVNERWRDGWKDGSCD